MTYFIFSTYRYNGLHPKSSNSNSKSNSPHKTRRVGGSRPLRSRSGQLRLDVSAAGHPGKETTRLAWFTQHRSGFDSKQTGAIKQQQQKQQQIGRCLWLYCQLSNCNEYALSGMGLLYLLVGRGVTNKNIP
eukprot:jgi/Psemu1/55786/gm1.55786_g